MYRESDLYIPDRRSSPRIAEPIRRQFSDEHHSGHPGHRMHNVGWSVQKPERRAWSAMGGRSSAGSGKIGRAQKRCAAASCSPRLHFFRESYAVFRLQVIARFLYESFISRERLFFDDDRCFAYNAMTFDLEVRFVTGPQGFIPEEG